MSAKAILVFCAQALLVKCALSQCIGAGLAGPYGLAGPGLAYDGLAGWGARGLAYDGLATPFAYEGLGWGSRGLAYDGIYGAVAPGLDFTPTSGGALPVTSGSAIAPVGISVISENVYEGILEAIGELPFVGTVAVEGVLPTAGAGAVNHACGNGDNSMVSGGAVFAPEYFGAAVCPTGAIAPGLGYRTGWAGRGYVL